LSCIDAAELLGISERHFRRLRDADEAQGAEGLIDKRRWRAPVDEIEWVLEQFRTRFRLHCEAFPRGDPRQGDAWTGAKFERSYHLDEERIAAAWADDQGQEGGASSPARAAAAAGDDAVPGRLDPRLAGGPGPAAAAAAGLGTNVKAANRWLASVYMARHNERFAVEAAEEGSAPAFPTERTSAAGAAAAYVWRTASCGGLSVPHSHIFQCLSYHFVDREADVALERVGPVSADQIESVVDVRF
jgi:hypothetical protein